MGDAYEITSALNKVQQVLNHYKAFKDIEAALKTAAASELLVSELGVEADKLRAEIAELGKLRDKLKVEVEQAKSDWAVAVAHGEEELAELDKQYDAGAAAARAELQRIEDAAAEVADRNADRTARAESWLLDLYNAAEAETKRLNDAKAALEELKANI